MGIASQKSQGLGGGEINFGDSPLDRNGPSKEFEKEFLKTFDEKGYKKKYGKEAELVIIYLHEFILGEIIQRIDYIG